MPFKIVRNDITRVRPFGTAHILKASCIFKLAGERMFQSRFTKVEICAFKNGEWLKFLLLKKLLT